MKWIKSSFSEASGNNCVEIAQKKNLIVIRDSKDPMLPWATVRGAAWSRFAKAVAEERLS
ncbi:DUF397 domain-containing protein [Streptomyces cellulosae]|uniref:DUF397 domain-containing protein n=1 Tax=Streptomyces cellulosae TaxID=1968 RepID=A0ABW7XWQ4_STRCE